MHLVFELLGHDPTKVAKAKIQSAFERKSARKSIYGNIPIKIVTILGAKGLTRDYTFLVNFDDRFLLEQDGSTFRITDGSICRFLVALTRARKQVCIYTSRDDYPEYVQWIPKGLIDDRTK